MKTKQIVLRLDGDFDPHNVWKQLPNRSRDEAVAILARLIIRAAKAVAETRDEGVQEEQQNEEHIHP